MKQNIEVPDRLPVLARGKHESNEGGLCAMEAASWLAGERFSDHPRSVHPVIAGIARMANDLLDDEARQSLWPLVVASIGTRRRADLRLHWQLRRAVRKARVASKVPCRDGRLLVSLWSDLLRLCGQPVTLQPERVVGQASTDRSHQLVH